MLTAIQKGSIDSFRMINSALISPAVGVRPRLMALADVGSGTGVPALLGGSEYLVLDEGVDIEECSEGSELVDSTDNRGWTTACPDAYISRLVLRN